MELEKIHYLCEIVGHITGVPLRVYEGDELCFRCAFPGIDFDPLELDKAEVWSIESGVGYYTSPRFLYYGVVRSGSLRVIMGPTRQLSLSDQEIREIAFLGNVPSWQYESFVSAIRSINPLALEEILQALFGLNFALNGQMLELKDVAILERSQQSIQSSWAESAIGGVPGEQGSAAEAGDQRARAGSYGLNAFAFEQHLLRMVRNGDIAGLQDLLMSAPAVRGGALAFDELRQLKNTFIVSAALASRAAIEGGMVPEEAFALSDLCIQECERLKTPEQITNLQYRMVNEFAEQVARVRFGLSPTPVVIAVGTYVQRHLSDAIKVEDIARELFMSRSYLSTKFKEETGVSLSEYVMERKIEEAKHLLRYTDRPVAEISMYLGFSSHGHFSRAFKKRCDVTPHDYRKTFTRM